MKTPEEIKKGLECCMSIDCPSDCPYINCDEDCNVVLNNDAIACIKYFKDQLREATKKIEQLERERDAAVEQLKEDDRADLFRCSHCEHEELTLCEIVDCENCDKECPCATCFDMSNWQWRGVQEVE